MIKTCEVCGKEMECGCLIKRTCSGACRTALTEIKKGRPRPLKKSFSEGTKWCPKCQTVQPLDNFYRSSKGKVYSYCRPCKRRVQNEWKRTSRGLPPDAVLVRGKCAKIGDTRFDTAGYVLEKVGTDRSAHHRADKNGWVYQHILVMERELGIAVGREFTIHHRNANRKDNRPENLELRVGPHGSGGDVIPTLLTIPYHREAAIRIFTELGYTVTPPATV